MWLIVRQLPMKSGWWDAPILLWDLAKTMCMILIMGGIPFCSHGGSLAFKFLSQLPTYLPQLSQLAQPQQISTQALPKITTQPQQSTNNNTLYRLHTFTLLLPLSRYPVPASPHNLPFFCSRHTSTKPVKMAPRNQQW